MRRRLSGLSMQELPKGGSCFVIKSFGPGGRDPALSAPEFLALNVEQKPEYVTLEAGGEGTVQPVIG